MFTEAELSLIYNSLTTSPDTLSVNFHGEHIHRDDLIEKVVNELQKFWNN